MIKACGDCDTINGTGKLCDICHYIYSCYSAKVDAEKHLTKGSFIRPNTESDTSQQEFKTFVEVNGMTPIKFYEMYNKLIINPIIKKLL